MIRWNPLQFLTKNSSYLISVVLARCGTHVDGVLTSTSSGQGCGLVSLSLHVDLIYYSYGECGCHAL